MRVIGSAYHPASDADYAITVGFWRGAFDAVLHLDRITPSRLLAVAPGPPSVNSVQDTVAVLAIGRESSLRTNRIVLLVEADHAKAVPFG